MTRYRVYFNRPAIDDVPNNVIVPDVSEVTADHAAVAFLDGSGSMIAFYPFHAILGVERIRD